ncbi:MAG: response regulator [Elusimicrobia bacterium]|nr:response regulator [Elusimicrobiota bacterium]
MKNLTAPVVWLIDDAENDRILYQEAFRGWQTPLKLRAFGDAEEALLSLRRQVSPSVVPDLIVLDLHMPRVNGFAFLAELKRDPRLREIPVFVVSDHPVTREVLGDYGLSAQACLRKPADLAGMVAIAAGLEEFWRAAKD